MPTYTIRIITNGDWGSREITEKIPLNKLPNDLRQYAKDRPTLKMGVIPTQDTIINLIKE